MSALWDTTGAEVVRELAAARRNDGVTSGLALTLVAVVDERPGARSTPVKAVEDAATVAAAAHPCRILVVTRSPVGQTSAPDRLDAEIVLGGRLGPCEAVIMRMQGRLALHAESVVMPLLAPDVPVVTWWHGPPPEQIGT
ncbi:MAG: glucose-6-phosphate dehydrogenase assembly protein OpcA, partial [Natronosporangium sp.]